MKNKEKFAKEIVEIACSGEILAKHDDKLYRCSEVSCVSCDFKSKAGKGCDYWTRKWAESEYIELKYETDWSKVPVDTPVINSNGSRYYFAEYNNIMDVIHVFIYGCTSWSSENSIIAIPTNTCKLFREEDRVKYRKLVD